MLKKCVKKWPKGLPKEGTEKEFVKLAPRGTNLGEKDWIPPPKEEVDSFVSLCKSESGNCEELAIIYDHGEVTTYLAHTK